MATVTSLYPRVERQQVRWSHKTASDRWPEGACTLSVDCGDDATENWCDIGQVPSTDVHAWGEAIESLSEVLRYVAGDRYKERLSLLVNGIT